MQPTHQGFCMAGRRGVRGGFTLIELIVSLTVISVAATIFVKLYMTSADLGSLAQHRELAATIAEGKLAQIMQVPDGFVWELDQAGPAGFFRVKQDPEDPRAGRKVELPDVLLPMDRAYEHQRNVYDKYRWAAFGRLPSPASSHFEVVVNVRWEDKGKESHVALTGAVARYAVDPDWAEE